MSAPRVPAGLNNLAACASRRGVIGALALAPTVAAIPALGSVVATSSELETLIARRDAAEHAFTVTPGADSGSPEEAQYLAALNDLDDYVPRTPLEFVRSFSARFSNDLPPNDDAMEDLVAIARRLASEGH